MCFFGVNYLSNPRRVFEEFNRLLVPRGNLLVVGGTFSGYGHLVKHWFKPEDTYIDMFVSGFTPKITYLPYTQSHERNDYYLVEGIKD